jgi:hypothetical protein
VSPVKYELGFYIPEDDILHKRLHTVIYLHCYCNDSMNGKLTRKWETGLNRRNSCFHAVQNLVSLPVPIMTHSIATMRPASFGHELSSHAIRNMKIKTRGSIILSHVLYWFETAYLYFKRKYMDEDSKENRAITEVLPEVRTQHHANMNLRTSMLFPFM